jgi:membrane protein insertase Oxa1/YidC/SpoIIIJ
VLYLLIKAAVSGVLVAAISEVARRFPGWGGLVASLPLVSLLAMTWLYVDTRDPVKVADLASSTFWFFLPSMPMFLIIPWLLRSGWSWAATMALAIAVTLALYALMFWLAPRLGVRL